MRTLRLLIFAWCVLVSTQSWAGQNTLDTDSFGGTNGNTLDTYSANWTTDGAHLNACTIRGTPGAGGDISGGICVNARTGQTWTDDQWAELTVDGTNIGDTAWEVCVRIQSDFRDRYCAGQSNGYVGNNTYRIDKWNSATGRTNLATGTHTLTAGDIVNFQIVGGNLTLLVNSVSEATATDTDYTTGNPGMFLYNAGTPTQRLGGTWKAGSVTTATTAHSLMMIGAGK